MAAKPTEPATFMFADEGSVPNNTRLPFLRALRIIPDVPLPDRDPVVGKDGPFTRLWHA